jgi:hypothetical protein
MLHLQLWFQADSCFGQVVWKVTPRFAEWISLSHFLGTLDVLRPDSTVLELGCGVSGIIPLTLGPKVRTYIATDQDYVLKILEQNISANLRQPAKKDRNAPVPNIQLLALDWETDSVTDLPRLLKQDDDGMHGVDLLIACDCIYNDALVEPFVSTCADICDLRSKQDQNAPTVCVIAQQLRSSEVFEAWLKAFHSRFFLWRVPNELLTAELKENSGYIVHVAILR